MEKVKKKDISRGVIERSALRLFNEKGVDATSVNDIVADAGIAKGTFYLYYRSRDELLDSIFDRYRASFINSVVTKNSENPKVISFAGSILDFFKDKALFLGELRKAARDAKGYSYSEKTIAAFTGVIIAFLRTDDRYPVLSPEIYARMIIGLILDICYSHIVEKAIPGEEEAFILLQDCLKRFFNCE